MPPAVFSSSTPSKEIFYRKKHSPHSNLCLACAFVLFGWSARADSIPTFLLIGGTPSAEDVSDPLPGEFAHESMTFQWGLLNSDQMKLCALKQQHLWWAHTQQRTGACKQKSHEISRRAQYQTLRPSLVDATTANAPRRWVCQILSKAKRRHHVLNQDLTFSFKLKISVYLFYP